MDAIYLKQNKRYAVYIILGFLSILGILLSNLLPIAFSYSKYMYQLLLLANATFLILNIFVLYKLKHLASNNIASDSLPDPLVIAPAYMFSALLNPIHPEKISIPIISISLFFGIINLYVVHRLYKDIIFNIKNRILKITGYFVVTIILSAGYYALFLIINVAFSEEDPFDSLHTNYVKLGMLYKGNASVEFYNKDYKLETRSVNYRNLKKTYYRNISLDYYKGFFGITFLNLYATQVLEQKIYDQSKILINSLKESNSTKSLPSTMEFRVNNILTNHSNFLNNLENIDLTSLSIENAIAMYPWCFLHLKSGAMEYILIFEFQRKIPIAINLLFSETLPTGINNAFIKNFIKNSVQTYNLHKAKEHLEPISDVYLFGKVSSEAIKVRKFSKSETINMLQQYFDSADPKNTNRNHIFVYPWLVSDNDLLSRKIRYHWVGLLKFDKSKVKENYNYISDNEMNEDKYSEK